MLLLTIHFRKLFFLKPIFTEFSSTSLNLTVYSGGTSYVDSTSSQTYTNKQTSEKVTTTEWHNIVVRNKLAEICEKYLSKGDRIYVEGRLKTRKWQDDSGNERYSTEIQCTDFTFLTTKKESEGQASNKMDPKKSIDNQQMANEPIGEEDDDLPF